MSMFAHGAPGFAKSQAAEDFLMLQLWIVFRLSALQHAGHPKEHDQPADNRPEPCFLIAETDAADFEAEEYQTGKDCESGEDAGVLARGLEHSRLYTTDRART